MSIYVDTVRTPSMKNRLRKRGGFHPDGVCELCGLPLTSTPLFVPIDYEQYEFVTKEEAQQRGEAVSLFPVGPSCYRRINKALESK